MILNANKTGNTAPVILDIQFMSGMLFYIDVNGTAQTVFNSGKVSLLPGIVIYIESGPTKFVCEWKGECEVLDSRSGKSGIYFYTVYVKGPSVLAYE